MKKSRHFRCVGVDIAMLRLPRPRTDAELEVLTVGYFGMPLQLAELWIYGASASYKVRQKYNEYHGSGWTFSTYDIEGYNHSARFWRHVIGPLSCGGIAAHSYGQTNIIGRREQARLDAWVNSRRQKQSRGLRTPFVRLAEQLRCSERTRQFAESLVLTAGREDGAAGASLMTVASGQVTLPDNAPTK